MEEPKNPEEILVYEIYKSIATPAQLQEMGDGLRQGKLGYGHIKNMLLDAVINEIKDVRENTIITWHISARSRICCRTVPSKRGRRLRQR